MEYASLGRMEETQRAPVSSHIVLADVRGSTAAVQAGKYREVNLAGAACVAAIRNVYSPETMPYVFGGDGATFLVADEDLESCLYILRGVQKIVLDSLGLRLTVGHMSLKEIRAAGADVHFGFLSWGPANPLPFFRGDGIAYAEKEIKRLDLSEGPHDDSNVQNANVVGLSCRLLPFSSVRGRILSLVVRIHGGPTAEDEILREIFALLSEDGPLERLRPVTLTNERRPWLSPSWRIEASLHSRGLGRRSLFLAQTKTIVESLLGTFLFRFDIKNSILGRPSDYTKSMLRQSDWIKMDGSLRLVIDVREDEEKNLLRKLEDYQLKGRLDFGMHVSKATVMTCHFQSKVGDQHTHFIDGQGGGLTFAATELKRKMLQQDSHCNESSAS